MDVETRQMRGCPYPCTGYTPVKVPQDLHVLGEEWYRGEQCPGAVFEDPVVPDVLGDFRVLTKFCTGNSVQWWWEQPGWWTEAMNLCQHMKDTLHQEAMAPHDAG